MNERKRAADQRLSVELPGIEPAAKSRVLLRGQTTRWDVADMSGMARLLAFLQVSNWDSELARLKVARLDGPEAPRALDPVYAERLPVTTHRAWRRARQQIGRSAIWTASWQRRSSAGGQTPGCRPTTPATLMEARRAGLFWVLS